jgi:hypothetical protein
VELHNLYASPNIIRVIKSRRMKLGSCSTDGWEDLKGRGHSKGLDVDKEIILQRILGKQAGKLWTECSWLRTGTSGGLP